MVLLFKSYSEKRAIFQLIALRFLEELSDVIKLNHHGNPGPLLYGFIHFLENTQRSEQGVHSGEMSVAKFSYKMHHILPYLAIFSYKMHIILYCVVML